MRVIVTLCKYLFQTRLRHRGSCHDLSKSFIPFQMRPGQGCRNDDQASTNRCHIEQHIHLYIKGMPIH
jgi:hypothetical protein